MLLYEKEIDFFSDNFKSNLIDLVKRELSNEIQTLEEQLSKLKENLNNRILNLHSLLKKEISKIKKKLNNTKF